MQIYFVTNEIYYSKLFRFLFREPTSHIGLGFFKDDLDLIVDCTKPYGRVYHRKHWFTKYRTVYSVDIGFSWEDEVDAYQIAAEAAVMVEYDLLAYYLGLVAGIKKRFFGSPLPPHNPWQEKEKKHCVEILAPLKKLFFKYGIDIRYLDLAAHTPHMIGKKIYKESEGLDNVKWPEGEPNAFL